MEQDGTRIGSARVYGKVSSPESSGATTAKRYIGTRKRNSSAERYRHQDKFCIKSSWTCSMWIWKSYLPYPNLHLGRKYNHHLELVWVPRQGSADVHGSCAGCHILRGRRDHSTLRVRVVSQRSRSRSTKSAHSVVYGSHAGSSTHIRYHCLCRLHRALQSYSFMGTARARTEHT